MIPPRSVATPGQRPRSRAVAQTLLILLGVASALPSATQERDPLQEAPLVLEAHPVDQLPQVQEDVLGRSRSDYQIGFR